MIGIPSSESAEEKQKRRRKRHVGTCAVCSKPTRIKGARYHKIGGSLALHCNVCAVPRDLQKVEAIRAKLLRQIA